MTEYFNEHYRLPPRCIALSDDAFGVLRLYHIDKDAVLEINLEGIEIIENFEEIEFHKKWDSFALFLNDFFLTPAEAA